MKSRLILICSILSLAIIILFSLVLILNQPTPLKVSLQEWKLPKETGIGNGVTNQILFSPDGRLLAGICSIGVWVYDVHANVPKALLTGHSDKINTITFSPDGKNIASASEDGSARLWDVATGKHRKTFIGNRFGFDSVSFTTDGKTLIPAGFREISLWNVNSGQNEETFVGVYNSLYGNSSFTPDGKTYASISNEINLWDINTGEEKKTLSGNENRVKKVLFSPDGKTLAGKEYRNVIHLWDVASGKHKSILTRKKKTISGMAFSPDGNTLATACTDKIIYMWNTETGKLRKKIKGHKFILTGLAFSPDGKTLAGSGWSQEFDDAIFMWDVGK